MLYVQYEIKKYFFFIMAFSLSSCEFKNSKTYYSSLKKKIFAILEIKVSQKKIYNGDLPFPFQKIFIEDKFSKILKRVQFLIKSDHLESYDFNRMKRENEYKEIIDLEESKEVFYNLTKVFSKNDKNKKGKYHYKLDKLPAKSTFSKIEFIVEKRQDGIEIVQKVSFFLKGRNLIETIKKLEREYGKFKYFEKISNGHKSIQWQTFFTKINRPRLLITLKTKRLRLILTFENK